MIQCHVEAINCLASNLKCSEHLLHCRCDASWVSSSQRELETYCVLHAYRWSFDLECLFIRWWGMLSFRLSRIIDGPIALILGVCHGILEYLEYLEYLGFGGFLLSLFSSSHYKIDGGSHLVIIPIILPLLLHVVTYLGSYWLSIVSNFSIIHVDSSWWWWW